MPKPHSKPNPKKSSKKETEKVYQDWDGSLYFICTKCGYIMRSHDNEIYHTKFKGEKSKTISDIDWVKNYWKKKNSKKIYDSGCENSGKTFYLKKELPNSIELFVRKKDRRALKRIQKM